MALRGYGKRAIQAFVDNGTIFNHRSLKGVKAKDVDGFGRLPEPHRTDLTAFLNAGMVDRVLYSYDTPIAWKRRYPDGSSMWVIPDVKYTATTKDHQNVVRVASENHGFYADARY